MPNIDRLNLGYTELKRGENEAFISSDTLLQFIPSHSNSFPSVAKIKDFD